MLRGRDRLRGHVSLLAFWMLHVLFPKYRVQPYALERNSRALARIRPSADDQVFHEKYSVDLK